MSKVTALKLQSLFDISVQYTGSVDNAYAIAFANNISVTDDVDGMELEIPDSLIKDMKVLNYLDRKDVIPATGVVNRNQSNQQRGIGFMRIGVDFKVS